ncbi:MAG: DUF559 domain-containing protein [Patescibacteria group bacterium]
MRVHNNSKLIDRRKELRRRSTLQENKLWNELRNNKLGVKFKRQHSISGYILGFYCFRKRLIIEIDGESHSSNKEYDNVRDKYFSDLGYLTLRFKNKEVDDKISRILNRIKQTFSLRPGEGVLNRPKDG